MNEYPPAYTATAREALRLERVPSHLTEDAFQEAMLHLTMGEGLGGARVAVRALKLAESRQRGGHRTVNLYPDQAERMAAPAEAERDYAAEDAKAALVAGALRHLDPLDAIIVDLRYGLGDREPLSVEQISRKLLLSISTVERRLRKSRRIMQSVVGGA